MELRLWEKVAYGEDTVAKIASREGRGRAGTRFLLDAICSLKLLNEEGDRYSLIPGSANYLFSYKPACKGGTLQKEYHWEGVVIMGAP